MTLARFDTWVRAVMGPAAAGTQVYICSQPAITTTIPPSPLVSLFADNQGVTPISQPLVCDGFGHAYAYVAQGTYTVVLVNGGVTQQVLPDQQVGSSSAPPPPTPTPPGGNSGDIQFNNSGAFGGDDNFTWDNTKTPSQLNIGPESASSTDCAAFITVAGGAPLSTPSDEFDGISIYIPINFSTDANEDYKGVFSSIYTSGSGNMGSGVFSAISGNLTANCSGTVSVGTGLPAYSALSGFLSFNNGSADIAASAFAYAQINGGTIGEFIGSFVFSDIGGGTISGAVSGLKVSMLYNGGSSSTINAAINILSPQVGSSTIPHLYGVYIGDQSVGGSPNADPWSLYIVGGKSYFGGPIADGSKSVGTNGQVLSSTGTGVTWIDAQSAPQSASFFVGPGHLQVPQSTTGSVLAASDNQVRVYLFHLPCSISVSNVSFRLNSATGTPNVGIGIYSASGSALIRTTFAVNDLNVHTNSVSTTLLPEGNYYLAQSTSDATNTQIYGDSSVSNPLLGVLNAIVPVYGVAANAMSAGVMPATLGTITTDTTWYPAITAVFC